MSQWLTPQRLGIYHLIEPIERGGMGVVFRAAGPSGPVAIKVLLSPHHAARFRREGAALADLRHPRIVTLLETGADPSGRPYIVMELLTGGSLSERLAAGPLTLADARALAVDLGAALEHAHAHGVLHRDVKPSNVLYDADGRAKLGDFGLAKLEDMRESLTRTGAMLGTPGYMAPEQVLGEKSQIGAATDVYGMAATLYHALEGHAPFSDLPALEQFTAILEHPAPRLRRSGVPTAWARALEQALAKDPAERPESAAALAAVFAAEVTAPRASRGLPATALVLAALTALGLGFALRVGATSPEQAPTPTPEAAETTSARGEVLAARVRAGLIKRLDGRWTIPELEADMREVLELAKARCRAAPEDGHAWAVRALSALFQPVAGPGVTADLERAVQLEPEVGFYWATLATRRARHDPAMADRELADADAAVAERLAPDDPLVVRALAQMQLRLRRYGEALRLIDRLLELEPSWADAHMMRAQLFAAQGDRAQAIRACETALVVNPRESFAHQRLTELLLAEGEFERARAAARRLRAIRDEPIAVELEATAYHLEGRFDDAAEVLSEGIRRFPDHVRMRLELAHMQLTAGKPRRALGQLDQLLGRVEGKDRFVLHYARARTFAALGQTDEARAELATARDQPGAEEPEAAAKLEALDAQLSPPGVR